ncbi:GNAT family N-acetyltransferase [Nocardioides dubius]|uniref:N-acetyltransferase domain-containing protein n=1 Tax=Nocardioides dubius TaxID=317019 RepID=A0ABN1TQA4_9ACTN
MQLRAAVADDLAAIAALFLRARRAAYGQMPALAHDDADVRTWVACWDLSRLTVWVAESTEQDAPELLGFVAFTETWLDHLYVTPSAQGGGVGGALLELVKALRPAGFSLWVFAANTSARGFYAAHGLVEREHTDGSENEEGEPDLRMEWSGECRSAVLSEP